MHVEAMLPPPARAGCPPAASQPRWSLVAAILGSTMAFLDGTIVNVALPAIQRALHGTAAEMQWIVEAYALLLASLVLSGGALGDQLGRKRVFSIGVLVFTLASAACAASPGATFLAIARAVQGIGGALLVPGSLALISAAYPEKQRGGAIGTWSAASGITTAIGPVVGGWLVARASWRWIFLVNVPLGALVLVVASLRVDESRDETASHGVDWLGAFLVMTGLGAIVFALLDAPKAGAIAEPRTLVVIAVGLALLAAFVVAEARQRHPMVPLALFRSRTFMGTNLLTLTLYAALGGCFFFVPFNLIQVQHYSPTEAGAALMPVVVLVSGMSPVAGAAAARYGARGLLVVGPLVAAIGFAFLAWPDQGGTYWKTFFPGMVVLGFGMGLTVAPLTTAVMGSVDTRHAGVASGINNAVSRAAGLLAVATLGAVLMARFDHALDDKLDALGVSASVREVALLQRAQLAGADFSRADPSVAAVLRPVFAAAYVAGFRNVMLLGAALAVVGAISAWSLVEPRRRTR